jgi:hypothetical protein
VIPINQNFSSDTLFAPFLGTTPVYSLKAYGNINLRTPDPVIENQLIA